MEQVALLTALALAVNKTVTVVKAIGKNWNMVITQAVVWVVGTLAIWLAAQADVTAGAAVPGTTTTFGALNAASIVLLGWVLGGTGSFLYDFRKSVDNSDSAAEPALLPPKPPQA